MLKKKQISKIMAESIRARSYVSSPIMLLRIHSVGKKTLTIYFFQTQDVFPSAEIPPVSHYGHHRRVLLYI